MSIRGRGSRVAGASASGTPKIYTLLTIPCFQLVTKHLPTFNEIKGVPKKRVSVESVKFVQDMMGAITVCNDLKINRGV